MTGLGECLFLERYRKRELDNTIIVEQCGHTVEKVTEICKKFGI